MTFVHRLDGADLSHHQHDVAPVDFDRLAAATWWCATKATQSTTSRDPTFTRHWAEMGRVRFRHRVAYHWLSPNTDPAAQARHFLDVWDRTGGAMLDAEENGITVDKCVAWLDTVEAATGRPVAVYSGLYVAGGAVWKSPRIRQGVHGARPMHLAAYTTPAKLAALQASTGTALLPVHAWQYSSNGPVPGVAGRCDMNQILDPAIYDRACAVHSAPPAPVPPTQHVTALNATGDNDMLEFVADSTKPADPFRWLSNGQVRTVPTEEYAAWLIGKRRVTNTLEAPTWLTPAELAGIPVAG